MKKYLSPNDLLVLSEMQRSALRDLWQPNKYDLAIEIVWKDVENDLYDTFVITVLDARAYETHTNYCEVVLKVFYLEEPPQYECLASETENEADDYEAEFYPDSSESNSEDMEETESEEDDPAAPSTEHLLSKENCLPMLNIGQMIEILDPHKAELNISFTLEEAICFINGEEFYGEELCDALWEAVKKLL